MEHTAGALPTAPQTLQRDRRTPPVLPESLCRARILVVDDEWPNLDLIRRILEQAGIRRIRTATDASHAIQALDDFAPDLVVLDLHMPGVDGFGVLEELRGRTSPDEYLPVLVLTADDRAATKRRALAAGARDFLNKPVQMAEVVLRIGNLLETRFLHRRLQAQNQILEERVRQRTVELDAAKSEALELLGLVAEYRDDETGQHTRRVGRLAALIARELGLPEAEIALLQRAAPLHDLGKVGIPDSIPLKPGAISPRERDVMRGHTRIGATILARSRFPLMRLAAEVAACHHERWDGTGYPRGLAGEEIPLCARIVALADVYDSLSHARPYKRAWTVADTVREIVRCSGTQFDPGVVDAFLAIHGRGALPVGTGQPEEGLRRRTERRRESEAIE